MASRDSVKLHQEPRAKETGDDTTCYEMSVSCHDSAGVSCCTVGCADTYQGPSLSPSWEWMVEAGD